MPPIYFRRWRYRRPRYTNRYRRQRYTRYRRPRKLLFRRLWRRRFRVRRRRRFKKKLSKIHINQWQPKTIRKCLIKGDLCLFACGRQKINHNYTLFAESIVPKKEPGGGAWSIMQLTFRALYDEYKKYRNWWTTSNEGLPLVKYNGVTMKFYRSYYTDYIVIPVLCPPFTVTREDYLNTQPFRALMNKNKIIVLKKHKNYHRGKYVKRTFKPPSLMQTKWYFQQDLCNTPLIILKTIACSFDQMWQPDDQLSYNITLYSLNIDTIQNPQFTNLEGEGYHNKTVGTETFHLYGSNDPSPGTDWKKYIPLFQTNRWAEGKTFTESPPNNQFTNPEYWGNPFSAPKNLTNWAIYTSKSKKTEASIQATKLFNLYQECRYNPLKDTGTGNKVYFRSNKLSQAPFTQLPDKEDIIIRDYPLWIVAWGWSDWIRKSKPIQHIEDDYIMVVVSPFITPKQTCYVFLDQYFINPIKNILTETENKNWHPQFGMQQEAEFYIAQAGPGAPKINYSKCIQATCNYKFRLKWGGCPAPMEIIIDPCQQEKYPVPNSEQQRPEIQDPATSKQHYLYYWDERDGQLTKRATKRIKTDSQFTKSVTDLGPKELPVETQTTETDETSTEEESETSLQETIQHLKLKQRKLKRQLRKFLR
nr:MAG: ORF1 [TTV-like mini virus]UGV37251.1 MAG: ORF1 [TTV-like mini virus]UGV42461.1 MAG: ORF1 [TTV-like mini virus]UGV42606.1 MAG: ORF1 [TTV-like mini virus]